jgi:hypothetical protein
MAHQKAQRRRFTGSGIAGCKGESPVTQLLFDAPTEVIDRGSPQESVVGDFRDERVPFQAIDGGKFAIHESSFGVVLGR